MSIAIYSGEHVYLRKYKIVGESVQDIKKNMNANSPNLNRFEGYTEWRWWPLVVTAGQIGIDYQIISTLPELETGNAELETAFNKYLTLLQKHETNHQKIYQVAANKIASMTTFDQNVATRITQLANEISDLYDMTTNHGEKEGVRFGSEGAEEDYTSWLEKSLEGIENVRF